MPRYAWAIFDYISPVPRDEEDNFYNAEDSGGLGLGLWYLPQRLAEI